MERRRYIHLTEGQWTLIQPLLSRGPAVPADPAVDDRKALEGILYVLQSGCDWSELPGVYGDGAISRRRFQEWQARGMWGHIWQRTLSLLNTPSTYPWYLAFVEDPEEAESDLENDEEDDLSPALRSGRNHRRPLRSTV